MYIKKDGPANEFSYDQKAIQKEELHFVIDNAGENTMYFMHIICESQSELTVKLTGPKLSTLGEHFTAEPYELSVYTYHAEGAPIEVTLFAAECVPRLYVQNIANLSKEHPVSQGRENYFVTLFHEST